MAPRATPGVWQDIYVDGFRRAKATPYDVYSGELEAGEHVVQVMGNKLRFTLAAGQAVFIRSDVDRDLFGKGIYPVLVEPAVAREELKSRGIDVDRREAPQ